MSPRITVLQDRKTRYIVKILSFLGEAANFLVGLKDQQEMLHFKQDENGKW
jgi:hypothetical protein